MDIGKWLWKKLRPLKPHSPKPTLKERLKRLITSVCLMRLIPIMRTPGLARLVLYAILSIGTVSLTLAWLIVFGFPKIELPSFQFDWKMVIMITLAIVIVLTLTLLIVEKRREKKASSEDAVVEENYQEADVLGDIHPTINEPHPVTTPNAQSMFQSEEPTTSIVSPEYGKGTVPPHAEHVEIVSPAHDEETYEEASDKAAEETVSETAENPPTRPSETITEETGTSWLRSGILHVAPWGIAVAATLLLFFSQNGGDNLSETQTAERPAQQSQVAPSQPPSGAVTTTPAQQTEPDTIYLSAAAPAVTLTVGKNWSKWYLYEGGKLASIRCLDPGVTYEVEALGYEKPFRYGPGLNPPIPELSMARVRAVGDKSLRIWMDVH